MGLLLGLGPAPDPVKRDELARVAGLVFGPDRLDRLDALAQAPHPRARIGPVVGHLLAVPAGADAELKAAAGQVVDRRDLLGGDDRVALDHQADAAADAQPGGRQRRRRQRDEQVVGRRVLARDRPATGVRGRALGRDVGVLGEEQRVVAALLDQPSDLTRADAVVGGEVTDSEFHARRVYERRSWRGGSPA